MFKYRIHERINHVRKAKIQINQRVKAKRSQCQ